LASITKVWATTFAVAQFYQRSELNLDSTVASIFPAFSQNGKEKLTIRHLLLHNSGLPAGPTPTVFYSKSFGCPETSRNKPQMVFTCQERIFNAVMSQPLRNPIGQVYVYSDLSMIVLQYVVGHYAIKLNKVSPRDYAKGCEIGGNAVSLSCAFEAYVRKYIFERVGLKMTQFGLPEKSRCPPGWFDGGYRNDMIQGFVSDGNSYSMGGFSGHAGMFSTIEDSTRLVHSWMFTDLIVNRTTRALFVQVHNATQSSRALGFDTAPGGSCGPLHASTYTHTGYFGTQFCCDATRGVFTLLFTNRVHPDPSNTKISAFRRVYGQKVKNALDSIKIK
jgi:CubicO group peptidase (beta-lactamase class C family)